MISPLGSRIVITVKQAEEKTAAGIFLPSAQGQTEQIGTVEAVGKGRMLETGEHIPPEVEVGDRVIFAKFAGTKVSAEGKEYFIIDERDILAKVS